MFGLPRLVVLVAALLSGALLLLVFVTGLIRVVRHAVVRRLALARDTMFRLDETGPLELHVEGPGRSRMPPVEFALEDRARDKPVDLTAIRLRSRLLHLRCSVARSRPLSVTV